MFTLVVDAGGVYRKFDTMALAAGDLDKPLAKFGGYLRKKAIERYRAQDFAPLAQSTIAKRVQKGIHSLERKLARDLRRAIKRSGGTGLLGPITGTLSRGAQNRISVLSEFQKRHAREWAGRKSGTGLVQASGAKPLSLKQLISLGQREDRAVARAVGKPILGGLIETLVVEVGDGVVTLVSRTAKEWSAVHNEGGSAGHGATMPQRETIRLDADDLEVLVSILVEHRLLPAFNEGRLE